MLNTIITVAVTTVVSSSVTAVVAGVINHFKSKKETKSTNTKALENGMLSLLRAEIIRQHDKYTVRKHCPIYAKDALEKAYAAYHSLGGNGTITKIYNDTMALPEEQKGN